MTLRLFGKSDEILKLLLPELGFGLSIVKPPVWPKAGFKALQKMVGLVWLVSFFLVRKKSSWSECRWVYSVLFWFFQKCVFLFFKTFLSFFVFY